MICTAVLVLRRTDPGCPRPFRVPGMPVVPILGILSCLALMLGLPGDTWLRLSLWLVVGLAIYLGYGRRAARLRRLRAPGLGAGAAR